jgi:hypothetical protein
VTYATADALRAALLGLHEQTLAADELTAPGGLTIGELFGGALLIRELTARQRLACEAAAVQDNPDEPDNALFRALVIQFGVVDPTTGTADAWGRVDPRTRVPLLSPEDAAELVEARAVPLQFIAGRILALSGMRAADHQRRHPGDDPAERDARSVPGQGGAGAIERAAA